MAAIRGSGAEAIFAESGASKLTDERVAALNQDTLTAVRTHGDAVSNYLPQSLSSQPLSLVPP